MAGVDEPATRRGRPRKTSRSRWRVAWLGTTRGGLSDSLRATIRLTTEGAGSGWGSELVQENVRTKRPFQ